MGSFLWRAAANSNVGTVRKINEDSFFHCSARSIWCVADGMGGHTKGDVASALIISELSSLLDRNNQQVVKDDLINCLQSVNNHLWRLSQQNNTVVGSTVALLFFNENKAHCIWAGDSRIYRLRNGHLQRLTRDHSQVAEMVDAGLISEDEAEKHPKANIITRAVGASESIDLECKTYDLAPDDVYLLCSDGLNKVISDRELETCLHVQTHSELESMADFLIKSALMRKAKDNVTCIAVFANTERHATSNQLDSTLPLKSW